MNIQGNRMSSPNEAILSGNEGVGDFGKFGDDKSEGPPRPRIGDVLSIHLSQSANSAAVWRLIVMVQVAQGFFQLGPPILTNPPSGGDPPARTVAFGSCPGAIGWKVVATCPIDGENANLLIQSSECCGGSSFGVTVNPFIPVPPPTGNAFLIFPTLAAASAFNAAGLLEGTPAWVQSVRRLYILEPASADPVTGADIITANPAGRWEAVAPG